MTGLYLLREIKIEMTYWKTQIVIKKTQGQRRAAWDNKLTITTPFSVEFDSIKKIVYKYLPILCVDDVCAEILKTGVNVVSRRAPSLGRYLGGTKFCSMANGKEFNIDSFYNCNISYVIYLITCGSCHVQYVGRSTRHLRDRFYEHVHSINKNKSTNVAKYFNHHHGGDKASLMVQVTDKIRVPNRAGDAFRSLCRREVYWIFYLQTRIPMGLNFEWDVSHFYEWIFNPMHLSPLSSLLSPLSYTWHVGFYF